MKDWFIFTLPAPYWSMDEINLVLPLLFLFLAHVLALCHKSHFSVLTHPDFSLWKPDLLFSLASYLSSPLSFIFIPNAFRKKASDFLLFPPRPPTGRILGERKDFLFLYTFKSYDFINLKRNMSSLTQHHVLLIKCPIFRRGNNNNEEDGDLRHT